MKKLEKLWNVKTAISRPGKVLEKSWNIISQISVYLIELYLIRSWIYVYIA